MDSSFSSFLSSCPSSIQWCLITWECKYHQPFSPLKCFRWWCFFSTTRKPKETEILPEEYRVALMDLTIFLGFRKDCGSIRYFEKKIQSLKSCEYLEDNTKIKMGNRTLVNTVSAAHYLNHLATSSHKVSERSENPYWVRVYLCDILNYETYVLVFGIEKLAVIIHKPSTL